MKSSPLDRRAKFQEFKSIISLRGNRGTGIAGQFAFLHSMQCDISISMICVYSGHFEHVSRVLPSKLATMQGSDFLCKLIVDYLYVYFLLIMCFCTFKVCMQLHGILVSSGILALQYTPCFLMYSTV